MLENDELLKTMDNVALVILLAHEVLKEEDSYWKPYFNLLPNKMNTVLFYSLEQFQVLIFYFFLNNF